MSIRIVKKSNNGTAPKMLSEVIDLLSKMAGLSKNRRRDMISACNSVARLVGRQASDIPAEPCALRALLAGIHPVQGRITNKRLANIRAELAAALQTVHVLPPPEPQSPTSDGWAAFLAKATAQHHRWGLMRFAKFCTAHEIEPKDVTDGVLQRFKFHLDARILTNDPSKIARDSAKNFNVIVRRNALDFHILSTTRGNRYVTLPLSNYPTSLQEDIKRYLKRLEKPDLFENDGPRRALRPMSVRNIVAHLRQILDAAVRAGEPVDRFKSLADLVDLDVLRKAADWMIQRNGGKGSSSLNNIFGSLLAIARHYIGSPAETVRKIEFAKSKLVDELGGALASMSQKSQRRMVQFNDNDNVVRIITLPEQLMKRANRNPGSQKSSMDAMIAAAISFLLACPALRMANLAKLHIGEDLTREAISKQVSFLIHIVPQKTKGRQAIDAVIGPPFSTIIDQYLKQHRHKLAKEPKDWVFPRRAGGPRSSDHFGEAIKKKIFDETGIVMNPHLFRHLSGALFLEAYPGEYESVRRLVSHAKIETTTAFYAPQSSRAAMERYAGVLKHRSGEP